MEAKVGFLLPCQPEGYISKNTGPDRWEQCHWILGLCLGCTAIFYLWWHEAVSFAFALRVFNVFTDTQMQGSLSSKLGLFTICSLFRWLGTTEKHLNSKIMLYTHTSSFLYPFPAPDIHRDFSSGFTELVLHRHFWVKEGLFKKTGHWEHSPWKWAIGNA